MESRPRFLLIGPQPSRLDAVLPAIELETVPPDPGEVARRLRGGEFAGVIATSKVVADLLDRFRRDELIIGHIDNGLAVLDPSGIITWTNQVFRRRCTHDSDPVGAPLLETLGRTQVHGSGEPLVDHTKSSDPLEPARRGLPVSIRIARPGITDLPYLDVDIRPVLGADGIVSRLIAVVRNVTPEVIQQQKLDALHAAGRELAGLDPDQLSEMNLPTRIELLKQNLRRYIHDLLHYDTIEVRLLDAKTGELKPLLEDGMTAEAAGRALYARGTGNGVTGYVAASGQSYLCRDNANDPLYIEGARGARSSMTVPLKVHDVVIGTLNVESPRQNGFGPDDLQFTELFSREIATALNTLNLLSAQQECTASQSIDAVNREIALPIDQVVANASLLLARPGTDLETASLLKRILEAAREVKDRVAQVGRDLAPTPDCDFPLAGRRVLVVDPDERARRSAHLLLSRLGAKVETAGTGGEGLAMANDNPYDAVLLDIKPPDLSGYDCYRRFRSTRPESSIAMTTGFGYDVAHAIVKARQDGLKYVLFKPFRQDQIVKAVLDGIGQSPDPRTATASD